MPGASEQMVAARTPGQRVSVSRAASRPSHQFKRLNRSAASSRALGRACRRQTPGKAANPLLEGSTSKPYLWRSGLAYVCQWAQRSMASETALNLATMGEASVPLPLARL